MSGFDLGELLPFYLDETDEQIGVLNDSLLKLEQDPSDAAVLREAFRMVHSIKGSSTIMGFEPVKHLTHHLETVFEQLRSGDRVLDRPTLDLSFRCLDSLRDYHRELRSGEPITVDLSGPATEVLRLLERDSAAPNRPIGVVEPTSPKLEFEPPESVRVTVDFAPGLPWPDMKAKLILTRLSERVQVLRTQPEAEQLEIAEGLQQFIIWLAADCEPDELRSLADVEGVVEIHIARVDKTQPSDPVPAKAHVETTAASEATASPSAAALVTEVRANDDANRPADSRPTTGESAASVAAAIAAAVAAAPGSKTSAVAPVTALTGGKRVAETLRVDVDRLDQMMNLAGELVISRARFAEIAASLEEIFRDSSARLLTADTGDRLDGLTHELESAYDQGVRSDDTLDRWLVQCRRLRENFRSIREQLDQVEKGRERVNELAEAIHQLARVSDGIQKGVLETRMVPIGPLFERFHRVVRDLRISSGKEVALRIDGEKTELDKRMVDELADPLIHLVRNCVDHGLERPEQREASGKPRAGTVSLQASHRGNSVVITVSDDGRGIDPEKIRARAVARGLVDEDEAHRLNDRQLVAFIWHPGFSTAEKVTDISGRGVGMDIVKSRIENLNGSVDVRSEPGHGTTFVIRLPLTLAIMPCLLFEVFSEVYAIPLDHIEEIVEVEASRTYHVRGRRMIEIRGRLVTLVALDDLLTWGSVGRMPGRSEAPGADAPLDKRTVVVARNGDATIGLIVDRLIGMQEVVLKALEKNFRPVFGLSGASILGDGRVSLILDVDALIGVITSNSVQPAG
jgi:two-component system chemotaxis sensor kinase CheA